MHLSNLLSTQLSLLFVICISPALSQDEVFKINKLNLIWLKAKHILGPTKLKDLKNDLSKQEIDELTLKKMKSHNQDKDGLFEAAVRKRLLSVMSKYSLEKFYDDLHPPLENEHAHKRENIRKDNLKDRDLVSELKSTFRDKMLDKLWKKAEQVGFTQEELMVLHEEFQHQQDRLDEHYETMNMIDQKLEERFKEGEKWENSIESTFEKETRRSITSKKGKESPSEKKTRLDPGMQQSLKEKHSDIKKSIEKLHKKIVNKKINADEGPFEEQPVNELWAAAVQSNLNESHLETLRLELEHYQTRIKKLKHFQVQLERNNIENSKDSNSDDLDDHETKHLRKRIKELTHKVEKTHKSIEKMIQYQREEL